MKRFLICLFSFLFIGCSIAGGAVLLSNSSYSDEYRGGDSSNSENDVTKNAPTNDDLWTDSGNYATSFAGGDGTIRNPYQIATAGQLAYLAYLLSDTTNEEYASLYYILTSNIDLSEHYWTPIGTGTSFSGDFDGDYHSITGLFVDSSSYAGLFRIISYGTISNLMVGNAYIEGVTCAGGIVGQCANSATIENCSFDGTVVGNHNTSNCYYGGIVGYSSGDLTINSCSVSGEIRLVGSSTTMAYQYAGGILGAMRYSGTVTIENCYNRATINLMTEVATYCGGIAGDTRGVVVNCYNIGDIYSNTQCGGICGAGYDIVNCWNNGKLNGGGGSSGAIAGWAYEDGKITNCYWTSECNLSNAVGRDLGAFIWRCVETEIENLKLQSWYEDDSIWLLTNPWNFNTIWGFVEGQNDGYPILLNNQYALITYSSNYGTEEFVYEYKSIDEPYIIQDISFIRDGYVISNWNTSADGTGVSYQAGDIYSENADLTLYAQWELPINMISLDWAGIIGGTLNEIYLWTENGYYLEEGCINKIEVMEFPTDNGFTFLGFYSGTNGTGEQLVDENGNFLTVSTTITTWHAYFIPNLSASYDDSGYWYVELGMMPQTKVTDEATISALNGTGLTSGNNYRFGDLVLESKVYGNEEYCEYNGNWYRVESIKWRLDYSTSQTVGFGTTEDTLAVMDTIVFVSQFSNTTLNSGDGYSTTAVTNLLDSFADIAYFETETKTMLTFGSTTINGTAESVTSNIFVASREEIAEVAGGGKIQFSDLVKDYLLANGQLPLYYTRDLGTNYNNIFCMNGNGESVQYKPQNYFGVQFSVLITEYGCIN